MILGTAGHIDHGKTALVKALTGVDTDRLPEEQRRGITIELGFAPLTLPGGETVGVVDVPGHERFVRAMAAGAGGVDVVLLVIAADEGVMPQTREHLDICRLLGVRRGVVALTKSDTLAELGPDWLALLEADVRGLLAGTFLEGAPLVPCSARTGEGLPALRAALEEAVRAAGRHASDGPLFLPVDRVFSARGFGTVVTGTVRSGGLALEESVSLLPGLPGPFRVRGLQAHGVDVARVEAGGRAAVNLAGLDAGSAAKGLVLCRHGELEAQWLLDVELELLPQAERPLPRRRQLLLHLGCAQLPVTVRLLEAEQLLPGERGLAQLRLSTPQPGLVGQRFILRGTRPLPGRGATLAGGRILGVGAGRRRRRTVGTLRTLVEGATPEVQVAFLLGQAGFRGLTQQALFAQAGLAPRTLQKALERLGAQGEALLCDREQRLYLGKEAYGGLQARARELLEAFHAKQPEEAGLSREELRQRLGAELSPRIFARVLQALEQSGTVVQKGERLALAGRGSDLSADTQMQKDRVVRLLAQGGLGPPTLGELSKALGLPEPRLLSLLQLGVAEGALEKVSEELYYTQEALRALQGRLVDYLRENGEISTQAFKELTGQSRKFVIPLSEYFDREKVTLRIGEKRVLRKGQAPTR